MLTPRKIKNTRQLEMKCVLVWKYLDEGIDWIYCSFTGTCGETTETIDGSSRADKNTINNKGRQI